MNTRRLSVVTLIAALFALAVFSVPVAASSASFSQLHSFSRLSGISSGTGSVPSLPTPADIPESILPDDPVNARIFSPSAHDLGSFTIQPFVSDKTAAEFARSVGPRFCGYCGC